MGLKLPRMQIQEVQHKMNQIVKALLAIVSAMSINILMAGRLEIVK